MKMCPRVKRPNALVAAFILILALSITAYAAGTYVVYQVRNGETELPEDGVLHDLTGAEPVEVLPYENWTEADGEVTVMLDAASPDQAE